MPAIAAPPAPAAPAAPAPGGPKPPAHAVQPPSKPTGTPAGGTPALPKEKEWTDFMGDAAAELDALSEGKPVPKPKAQPPKPPVKKVEAPAAETPEQPETPEPEPVDQPGAPEVALEPEPEPQPEPKTMNELREHYKAGKTRIREMESETARLTARIKQLEEAEPKGGEALTAKMQALEKRNAELESQVQFVDYQSSQEFKDKYHAPYVQAWDKALRDLTEIEIELPNGGTRVATKQDLEELCNMPLGAATRAANAKFGDLGPAVMLHRERIIDLAEKQEAAIENAKKQAVEKAQADSLKTSEEAQATRLEWNQANQSIETRWPGMFAERKDDPEGNALLKKGTDFVDRLFSPNEQTRPKNRQEMSQLCAMVRQKARNHDRLAMWLKKTRAELKEAKDALAEYEASEPSGGLNGGRKGGGGRAPTSGDYLKEANEELDALSRKSGV